MNINELSSIEEIQCFIFARQAVAKKGQPANDVIFTIHNENNDHHFTYKLRLGKAKKRNILG